MTVGGGFEGTMNARTALFSAALFAVTACGLPETEEEDTLITDSELSLIQTAEQASTSSPTATTTDPTTASTDTATTTPPAVAPFHLRLAWGYLSGNRRTPEWQSWTGGAGVTSGTMRIEHLIFFDRRDFPVPTSAPNTIAWRSRTLPHFDGVVAKVEPGSATDQVTVRMPLFNQRLDVAALAAGSEQHFVLDNEGHELSISSVPANGCSGFSFGYMKQAPAGWLGFAGVITNGRGQRIGIVRFRSDNGAIRARAYVGRNLVAEGTGTLDATAKTFSISFTKLDGSAGGTVSGLYVDPAYSPRGSFQANGTGHCN